MAGDDSRQSFLAALEEVSSLPGATFIQNSIEAAFGESADYRQALTDFRLQDQTELDLHLTGATVKDHATRADWLGKFMLRTSVAVKELAKGIAGTQKHTPGLLVEGPSAGSVRVTFRSPSHKSARGGMPGTDVETLDGKALHQFASLFMLAEDDDELLAGSIRELRGEARRALNQVSKCVVDAAWTIEGDLAARGRDLQHVVISPNGAARVMLATKVDAEEVETVRVAGAVDSWTWSKSVMDFLPDGAKPFRAVVPPRLQETVAAINGQANHDAVAWFIRTTMYPSGDYSYQRKSYVLDRIEAVTGSSLDDFYRS
jgi:hypothetical protein